MALPVDHQDLLRKITGGDSGLGETIMVSKGRHRASDGVIATCQVGKPYSFWEMPGDPCHGSPASGARVPTMSTDGAVKFTAPTNGRKKYLAAMEGSGLSANGHAYLMDRLAEFGGLVSNSNSLQSTTGCAVSRYTGTEAAGNQLFFEVYTNVSNTFLNVTVAYTNESGASHSTTGIIGSTSTWPRLQFMLEPVSLAAGDLGIRSVESVTVASGGAVAGNWGVVIARPLAYFSFGSGIVGGGCSEFLTGPTGLVEVKSGACLWAWGANHATNPSPFDLALHLVEM